MRSPGFEPGLSGWEPSTARRVRQCFDVLTKLDYDRIGNTEIDWLKYKEWLSLRYSSGYVRNVYSYSKKYVDYFTNVQKIASTPNSNRNNIIDSLIALRKFLGFYQSFQSTLKTNGVKKYRQDSIQSFLRILNSSNKDTLQWLEKEALPHLNVNEQLFVKFLKLSGLRLVRVLLLSISALSCIEKEG